MPNLKKYFSEEGTEFENHVAAQPVCGPSRSSMLLGRYPHNTGYVMNDDLASVAAYKATSNDTIGTWLRNAGRTRGSLRMLPDSARADPPCAEWQGDSL